MEKKNLYVVYRLSSGEIVSTTIRLAGVINHEKVADEIYNNMEYYDREYPKILSWQEEKFDEIN